MPGYEREKITLSAWSDNKIYGINNYVVQTKWICHGDNESESHLEHTHILMESEAKKENTFSA